MKRKATVVVLLSTVLVLFCSGCNAYATADKAYHVVDAAIGVALAELPSLQNTGLFTPTEGTTINSYLVGLHGLNDAYGSCVDQAHTAGNKKAAFLTCAGTFAQSLSNPQQLSALRVVNPNAQKKVQTWIVAISTAINVVSVALGGQPAQAPVVSEIQPTTQDLQTFERQVYQRMEEGQ